jgi:hypothetical protein
LILHNLILEMKKFFIPRVSIENVDIVPPEVEEPPFNVAGVEVHY